MGSLGTMLRWSIPLVFLLVVDALPSRAALPRGLRKPVEQLRAVGREGSGNEAAGAAWRKVAAASPDVLPDVLGAMDGANDYALNWLRTAAEAIEQRARQEGRPLPVAKLEAFLKDTRHHPRARHLAFHVISRADSGASARLLPLFVQDPSNDLRREAVDRLVASATATAAKDKAAAVREYEAALGFAREADQVDAIAKRLSDLGQKVDLQAVFGWVTRWHLIGPFDNGGGAGFEKAFAPESGFDAAAQADGKKGRVSWVEHTTKSEYGLVDFHGPFGMLKEVTGYAHAEFWSDDARDAEVRLGCKNGWKVWVNGTLLFGRDEYHRNMEIDQYRMPVRLKKGRNEILVKCCQNEQTEEWTKEWEFQLRLTDAQGTPIRSSR